MTEQELKDRIACLEREIDEAPGWGAAVGAMGEELRSLKRQLANRQDGEHGQ